MKNLSAQTEKIRITRMISIVLAAGVLCAGCGRDNGNDEPRDRRGVVEVQKVAIEDREFERVSSVQGTISAREFALVPARIGGTLHELLVQDGAHVTKGTELAIGRPIFFNGVR